MDCRYLITIYSEPRISITFRDKAVHELFIT